MISSQSSASGPGAKSGSEQSSATGPDAAAPCPPSGALPRSRPCGRGLPASATPTRARVPGSMLPSGKLERAISTPLRNASAPSSRRNGTALRRSSRARRLPRPTPDGARRARRTRGPTRGSRRSSAGRASGTKLAPPPEPQAVQAIAAACTAPRLQTAFALPGDAPARLSGELGLSLGQIGIGGPVEISHAAGRIANT